MLLCSLMCVFTWSIINLLLCFFPHWPVKASSFTKGLCFIRSLPSFCGSCCNSLFPQSHMSLSNYRISPYHLILFNSRIFFSLFYLCCVHPDTLPPVSLPQLLLFSSLSIFTFPFFLFLNFSFFSSSLLFLLL